MTTPTCIYRPANYLEPTPWEVIFGRAAPVEIDVGTGKGTYLVREAQRNPDRNYLGIDRLLVRLRKADAKVRRLGLTNVRLVRLEAGYFVRYLVPTGSVAVYHIYCPDPWPKRRHQRRRLINEEFVEALHRTLKPGGEVRFSTDDLDYYGAVVRVFGCYRGFCELSPPPHSEVAQTDFEALFASKGQSIYRKHWRKFD
ncbi:MAG: tRNA (guanosine(46)-N7)-methyltransferase TrmB [Verrucomicrobiae bacterium]|nr:tRNA (guanosine(46)-N7)-methyltransferase TrmB [Verrucomicrobiae bacterium]